MATEQALVDLLTQTVTLRRLQRDSMGNSSEQSGTSESAHIEYMRRQTFDREGEKVVSTATIFFDDTITFDWSENENEWEVEALGLTFQIVSTEAIYDPRDGSLHHWEMLCV